MGIKTHISVSAMAGSAVGRLLSILVPQFLCQENGGTVVARAKLIRICLYCPVREPVATGRTKYLKRWPV